MSIRVRRILLISAAALLMTGCGVRIPRKAKLPLISKTRVEFRGVADGKCTVADVAITTDGGYVVTCLEGLR